MTEAQYEAAVLELEALGTEDPRAAALLEAIYAWEAEHLPPWMTHDRPPRVPPL